MNFSSTASRDLRNFHDCQRKATSHHMKQQLQQKQQQFMAAAAALASKWKASMAWPTQCNVENQQQQMENETL